MAATIDEGTSPFQPNALTVAVKERKRSRGNIQKKVIFRASAPRVSGPKRPASDPDSRALLFRLSRLIRYLTNGMSGNTEGVDGSVNATSVSCILRSLRAKGRNFIDFGCGYGWMCAAAYVLGAFQFSGIELRKNAPQRWIYTAIIKVAQEQKLGCATASASERQDNFHLYDIHEVFTVSIFSLSLPFGDLFFVLYWAVGSHRWLPLRVYLLEWYAPRYAVLDTLPGREVINGQYRCV